MNLDSQNTGKWVKVAADGCCTVFLSWGLGLKLYLGVIFHLLGQMLRAGANKQEVG